LSDKRTIKLTQIQMLMTDNLIILFTFLTFSQNACSQQTPIDDKLSGIFKIDSTKLETEI